MLDYLFFYDLCHYTNNNWKGFFTERDLSNFAHDYKIEYDYSISRGAPSDTMKALCELICEDIEETLPENFDINAMNEILERFSKKF